MKYIFKSCTPWTSSDKKSSAYIVWYKIPRGRGIKRLLSFAFFDTKEEAEIFIKTLKKEGHHETEQR